MRPGELVLVRGEVWTVDTISRKRSPASSGNDFSPLRVTVTLMEYYGADLPPGEMARLRGEATKARKGRSG
jgi:hypothetical protein